MIIARRFLITGNVHGVGFRAFAQEAARLEGLNGWVMNLPDGRVEAVAEGDRESVDRFEAKMRRGPARAKISAVIAEAIDPSGQSYGFSIK